MAKIFTLILFPVLIFFSCSGPTGPQEVVTGYLNAHNRNDIEAVMNYYHDDAVLIIPGQPPIDDIRKAEAWDAAINSKLEYSSWDVRGDTVVIGKITEKNNWFKRAGIKSIEYEPGSKMVVTNGKISEVIMAPITPESLEALNQMYEGFLTWMNENHPEKLEELMPGGELIVSEEMALQWFALLDEWQRSK